MKGFNDLVKAAMKIRPGKPKDAKEIWDKFLYIVFMGGKRSEPEINLVIRMLKPVTDMDYVTKTGGEDWREAAGKIIDERLSRIKDEEILVMLKEFRNEMFRISASIKGGARFFKKNEIGPEKMDELLSTKEKTWEFIENLAEDKDVSNIKYTKIIIWLHSLGYANDFCPPGWQTKKFVNDEIGPYYPYYEDDKYFIKKAGEFADEIKKEVKGATTRDVSMAMFYYITLKNMLPSRSPEKKAFDASMLIKFLKQKKLTLSKISELLADFEGRDKLMKSVGMFVHKNI
ncbi:MAG: hypothetical protein HYT72_04485 [Candidatus Aenigmarchaeota archaeon]|nr:hypothetical protein [Candidatus Aenigmarchaeota archaeon]